jgi:hypothetical protein
MRFRVYPLFIGLVVAGTVGGIAFLEFDKSQLRRQISQLDQHAKSLARLRAESARQQVLLDRFKTSREEGAKAIPTGRESETKIPMVRSAAGWAMAVGEKQIDVIRRGLAGETPAR